MAQKILIIDDELDFLEIVRMRLEANNYEVITAKNGDEGIEKAQEYMPDIILVDIMMPNVDGGQVVKVLKHDARTENIPVIFLTAVLTKQDEVQGKKINIEDNSYPAIAKPFDPKELLRKIQETISPDNP